MLSNFTILCSGVAVRGCDFVFLVSSHVYSTSYLGAVNSRQLRFSAVAAAAPNTTTTTMMTTTNDNNNDDDNDTTTFVVNTRDDTPERTNGAS